MANSFLNYQSPSTPDKKLDSESVVVDGQTVERERVQMAGAGAAEIVKVTNDQPGNSDYGAVVRPIPHAFGAGGQGRKAVAAAGAPEALGGSVACKKVIITALQSNTDVIVVGLSNGVRAGVTGDTGSTRTGIPLFPNQALEIDVQNLNLIYLDAVVSGEGASYAYLV